MWATNSAPTTTARARHAATAGPRAQERELRGELAGPPGVVGVAERDELGVERGHPVAPGRRQAAALLETGGPTVWIDDESLMDAVTAVSGSGPAYVFLLAEAMQAAAERQGLASDTAALLVRQTIAGAAAIENPPTP